MLDPLQFYCRVLCNGMKMRFRMVMIAHPGPGIGFHKRFMWRIIIPPTPVISYSCGKPPERHMFLHSPWVTVQLEQHLIRKSLSPHFYLLLNSFTTPVHPWPQPHTHKTPALHSQLPYCPPVILWHELSTRSHSLNWDLYCKS